MSRGSHRSGIQKQWATVWDLDNFFRLVLGVKAQGSWKYSRGKANTRPSFIKPSAIPLISVVLLLALLYLTVLLGPNVQVTGDGPPGTGLLCPR
jgi:hypothetical protein